jgi:hypothetical protein
MSRHLIRLDKGKVVLVGYDRPFGTYYAMLYTPELDSKRLDDEPDKAVGYHPMERSEREITEHGPYPVSMATLLQSLKEWGLDDDQIAEVGRAAAQDPDGPGH